MRPGRAEIGDNEEDELSKLPMSTTMLKRGRRGRVSERGWMVVKCFEEGGRLSG
jgi:hypothetical protein